MSPAHARLVVLLVVLTALVGVKAQQPGDLLAIAQATPESFPRTVVARTAPAPNIYGGDAKLRVLQLVDALNGMWARAFAAAGDEYERPRVRTAEAPPSRGCGSQVTGWAGVYCSRDRTIVIDIASQQVHRALIGEDGADAMLGYVLAHELGHHVQHLRGRRVGGDQDEVLRAELHAECLAGVWGRAAGHAPPPPWSYAEDADHGTVEQQRLWLERGHARARPADCDAVFTDGPAAPAARTP